MTDKTEKNQATSKKEESDRTEKKSCGIIMPISAIDGCSADHWKEVQSILKDIIQSAGFEPNLVSDADEIGVIQKRIIHNIYNNPIVVCDVSGKNPNVMFELGMRLAFDKPTIIIKDDHTDYTFDTSVIEHLVYPRDLRFSRIVQFKEKLKEKILATFKKSIEDPNYTTFLKHFGEYQVAQIEKNELSSSKYIENLINELRHEMNLNLKTLYKQSKIPFDHETAEIVINRKIHSFLRMNNLERPTDIFTEDQIEDLIRYLKGFIAIQNVCPEEKILRDIVNRIILPF